MGGRIRYTEAFKLRAAAQVTDKGHNVTSVAVRFGVSTKSLYDWVKRYGGQADDVVVSADAAEIKRLKAELRRVTERHITYVSIIRRNLVRPRRLKYLLYI